MNDLQQRFNCILEQIADRFNLDLKRIAIAVSGGADSLALALLAHNFALKHKTKIAVLTVNHHLRDEAYEEALYVAKLMQNYRIEHHILDWDHEKLTTGIETKARQARYDLLCNWCKNNNFKILMTAHHLRDQAETFLMRLQRGSGIDGLASMETVSERDGTMLVRPLLGIEPDELRDFLKKENVEWKEDASNQCDDFLRVRVRKILPLLERELGLSVKRIGTAVAAIAEVRDYLGQQADDFINNHCRNWYNCAWSFSPSKFEQLHPEIRQRVMAKLIRYTVPNQYPPEYVALRRLCHSVTDKDFSGSTLAGCEIVPFQKKIWVMPEIANVKPITNTQWEVFTKYHADVLKNGLPYKLKLNLFKKFGNKLEFGK